MFRRRDMRVYRNATVKNLTVTGLSILSGTSQALSDNGAVSVSGLLFGRGTTADPAESSTPDAKFVELRCKSTAISGDNRLMYLRYELAGVGGGECLRAQTMIEAAVGTAHGGHVGLTIGATAGDKITGLGVGMRSTLMIGDKAVEAGGTYFGGMTEIYMEGSSSDLAAVNAYAIHSLEAAGNATGLATVLNALAIKGGQGTGKMIYNNNSTGAAESNGSVRILVDEGSGYVARFLRYWDAENS
ncbi:hypothetical protein KAT92_06090 [Candidatus Babeliales bacterium]|nr:hypothetical protein [Candidatus Babeliales bacterium]